jgi:hypothetical protein
VRRLLAQGWAADCHGWCTWGGCRVASEPAGKRQRAAAARKPRKAFSLARMRTLNVREMCALVLALHVLSRARVMLSLPMRFGWERTLSPHCVSVYLDRPCMHLGRQGKEWCACKPRDAHYMLHALSVYNTQAVNFKV